ncbi:MAG TPA: DUF998 domain-containing protein [Longimicrobium sp.]|nr:DUF998 domain-containing protein [Longimicrobium sp.]
MTTITIPPGHDRAAGPAAADELRPVLLVCGILSALFYAAMVGFVPMWWPGYSAASQTISELSAIGAPTRSLWIALGVFYTLLVLGFGWGVWMTAGRSRRLRAAGGLIIAAGAIGPFWPPMHLRGAEPGLTDTLHIVFAIVWNLLSVATIVLAAAALGRRFRLYSAATLAVFVVFGTLTGMDGPRIARNLPTPWAGVWERVLVAAWLLWVVVLAAVLLRASLARPARVPPRNGVPDEVKPMVETPAGAGPPRPWAGIGTSHAGADL